MLRKGWSGRSYSVGRPDLLKVPEINGVHPLLVQIASQREIPDSELEDFFFPTLKNLMVDPAMMTDMTEGATVLVDAIESGVGIGMVGDYDVDGATSVAIMSIFLSDLGHANQEFYIPQRLSEGYGINKGAVQHLYDNGARVLLILDSGTTANEPIAFARELGMNVVVLDHHEPGDGWIDTKPDAFVINPKREDDRANVPYLCTAGLAILLAVRISTLLKERGWTGLPDIMEYMGLAALGTVADLMPLKRLNRAYVRAGLGRMHILPGLAGLAMASKNITSPDDFPELTAYDLGFLLGPAVNAAGRIDDCSLGATLLTQSSLDKAVEFGKHVVGINQERKAMQEGIQKGAEAQAAAIFNPERDKCLVVYDESWHPGIIGIVAGRLKELYNIPVVVIGTGGKGSGRSAHGFNLGGAFIDARKEGLLIAGGGHQAAGGLTIDPARVEEFRRYMAEKASGLVSKPDRIDGIINIEDITSNFVRNLNVMEPFGMNNPKPVWLLRHVTITSTKWVKDSHLRVMFQSGRTRLGAIVFNAKGGPLQELDRRVGETVSLLVQVSQNKKAYAGFSDIDIVVKDVIDDED